MTSLAQSSPVPRRESVPRSPLVRAWVQALLLAIPAEFLLFCIYAYPVDDGFSVDSTWYGHIVCTLSLVVHWPGLVLLGWLERAHASAGTEMFSVVSIGYCDLSILLFLSILAVRWLYRRRRHGAIPASLS